MKITCPFTRGEIAILGACAYLGALFISVICLWWVVVIGGNPFTIENIAVINRSGSPVDRFRAGDPVAVKRRVCADSETPVEQFPALRDAKGVIYPLPDSMTIIPAGCTETLYGFIAPALPPGEYTFVSVIKFQKNLVGRDEQAALPQLRMRVMRKRSASSASEPDSVPEE